MSEEILAADANLNEIARLRSELAAARDVLAQRDRALVAAHRAIEIAQADAGALREAADGFHHAVAMNSGFDGRFDAPTKARSKALMAVLRADHPGAALLSELDAAVKARGE